LHIVQRFIQVFDLLLGKVIDPILVSCIRIPRCHLRSHDGFKRSRPGLNRTFPSIRSFVLHLIHPGTRSQTLSVTQEISQPTYISKPHMHNTFIF
jgi:hypothetical protein